MSTIGGGKSGWRAGGDKGNQPFSMSDEQWDRVFGVKTPDCASRCGDCEPSCSALNVAGADEEPTLCAECEHFDVCEYGECIRDES